MSVQGEIESNLQSLEPVHLDVINESYMHNVPEGSESHFKVIIVSEAFVDQGRVVRHRMVNELLAEQLKNSVHALSVQAKTPDEWFDSAGGVTESPACLGGQAAEREA